MKYSYKAVAFLIFATILIVIAGCTKEPINNETIHSTELSEENLFEDILSEGDPIVFPGIPMEDSWDDDEKSDSEIIELVPDTGETVPEVTETVTETHGKGSNDQNDLPGFSVDEWENVGLEAETPTVETAPVENDPADPPANESANNLPGVSENEDWEQESTQEPTEEASQEPIQEMVTPPEETSSTDPIAEDSSSELPDASSDAEW